MRVFGIADTQVRRVVVAGGGHIGTFVGEIIEREFPGVTSRIIEADHSRAHLVADQLEETVVIHGDVDENRLKNGKSINNSIGKFSSLS